MQTPRYEEVGILAQPIILSLFPWGQKGINLKSWDTLGWDWAGRVSMALWAGMVRCSDGREPAWKGGGEGG